MDDLSQDNPSQAGVTLLELLITLALVVLVITAGIPAFGHWLDRQRLTATAEDLRAALQRLRAETLMQQDNRPLYLHFRTGDDWCFGASHARHCDCHAGPAKPRRQCRYRINGVTRSRRHAALHPAIELVEARFSGGTSTRFDPLRGLAAAGRLTLENRHRDRLQIRISPLGRIRLCSPGGVIAGYGAC